MQHNDEYFEIHLNRTYVGRIDCSLWWVFLPASLAKTPTTEKSTALPKAKKRFLRKPY